MCVSELGVVNIHGNNPTAKWHDLNLDSVHAGVFIPQSDSLEVAHSYI